MVDADHLAGPRGVDLIWNDERQAGSASTIHVAILSISVQYTMDVTSQVTVEVHDPDFELARSNYFAIAQTVWYRSWSHSRLNKITVGGSRIWQRMEIANATMGPGPAAGAVWSVLLRPKGCQQLKRNRTVGTIGGTGSGFIRSAATWAGLDSVIQSTSESNAEWQADGETRQSAWDVMQRVASESAVKDEHARFMLFEVDNTLFFGTQRWMLGRWGMTSDEQPRPSTSGQPRDNMSYIYIGWPPQMVTSASESSLTHESLDVFRMMALPRMTRSDNNPLEVTGSVQLDRFNARALRPGMTIYIELNKTLKGTSYFNGYYLINDVSFDHYGTSPVSVSFRSPERVEKDIRSIEVGDRHTADENTTRA